MSYLNKLLHAAILAAFFVAPAHAQNAGTVTNHAFVLGKGAGTTGYTSLLCGSAQLAVGQSSADPICQTITGDVTINTSGVTAIGASKVTNSQLATMTANTTKCNATAGTANPTDCSASTMRTNMGVVIGTNVQAWDSDLDCVAALSSTGQIKRTGAGTCSAGSVALGDLATGTQDTVVGYFGSTTASATSVPNCTGALIYSTSTHTFSCNATAGTGTVTGGSYPLSGSPTMAYVGPTNFGQLQFSSSTSIKFMPYNGDMIRIAGAVYQIPSAGVDSGNPSGGVFLNGTGSSTLAINTLYYVYAFNNSGALALDFSTTAYAVDSTAGNIGTYIKSGTASRSLVGMIRTGGTVIFVNSATQRFVRSWFNEAGVSLNNNFTAARTSASASVVELNSEIRCEFLIWSGEAADFTYTGSWTTSVSSTQVFVGIAFSGTTPSAGSVNFQPSIGRQTVQSVTTKDTGLSEGYQYATMVMSTDSGGSGVTFNIAGAAGIGTPSLLKQLNGRVGR